MVKGNLAGVRILRKRINESVLYRIIQKYGYSVKFSIGKGRKELFLTKVNFLVTTTT